MRQYTVSSIIRAGAWGAVVGGATGFAMGIMLAPEKGQKIRRKLVYRLERVAEQITMFLDQVTSPEQGGEARRSGDALVADAKARAEHIRNDIDALLGEIRRTPSRPSPQQE